MERDVSSGRKSLELDAPSFDERLILLYLVAVPAPRLCALVARFAKAGFDVRGVSGHHCVYKEWVRQHRFLL